MRQNLETRIRVVKNYLKRRLSLRTASKVLRVPHQTLYRWIKWYKEGKNENFKEKNLPYKMPWNRASEKVEKKVALLKEKDPSITVRKAKALFAEDGTKISLKGIWNIWRRYGYSGFKKENMTNDFLQYIPFTKEAEAKLKYAEKIFEKGEIRESANILNTIPSLPKNELISKIPNRYLNKKRQAEKLPFFSGEISLRSFLMKTKSLHNKYKRQNLNYSTFRTGLKEIMALWWCGKPEKALKKIEELKKVVNNFRGYSSSLLFEPKFTLFIGEGLACALLSKIKKAEKIARLCQRLLRRQKYISPYFMIDLGALYTHLEDYKKAEYWFLKALNKVDEETNKRLKARLALTFLRKGEYKKALFISKGAEFIQWSYYQWKIYFDSVLSLMHGMPQKAIALSLETLSHAKKAEFNIAIVNAYFTIASAYASLGEKKKANQILLKLLPFLVKHRLERERERMKVLLDEPVDEVEANQAGARDIFPTIKLAYLIKKQSYFKAFECAKKKCLLTYFYLYLFFFPENITKLFEKGMGTKLPKALLRMPVFNKDIPVYNIKFLGDLTVEKNGKYLRFKLKPKDKAFLIHLALRLETPGKVISLESLYENFWKDKSNPRSNLSHMLLRIKKALKIPSHLLEIFPKEGVLKNKGIYWTTDYLEYEQALANAKAFLKAGEWKFAEREFLTALSLMRGAPFEKMYDNWSDEKRLAILNQYENEVAKFAKELEARKKHKLAEKVLKKAKKMKLPAARCGVFLALSDKQSP